MKQHFITRKQSGHLLLFFTGWGMDETPFLSPGPVAGDWMICYDYRTLTFDSTLLHGYSGITVLAWSMGVWAASQVLRLHPSLPVVASTAVNGTPHPIDGRRGIAPAIFEGTLQGLNEQTLRKFQRRMCGSATGYKEFQAAAPRRTVGELKEELAAIGRQCRSVPPADVRWQTAIIGEKDRIFLPECQREAWQGKADTIESVSAAHYQRELFERLIRSLSRKSLSAH